MLSSLKNCESQALRLPLKDRAVLAEQLLASLEVLNDVENERLGVEEAERRYRAYRHGKVSARTAQKALQAVRDNLKRPLKNLLAV